MWKWLCKGKDTLKFFFQGISSNTVSGSFNETWNNFMKYFYFSIQHSEAVVQMCSVKKLFLEISQNSQENTCTRFSFLIKLQVSFLINRLCHRCFPVNFEKFLRTSLLQNTSGLQLIKKEALEQVFSCEFCEILRTLFVTEHLRWLLLYVVEEKLQQPKLKS